MPPDCVIIYTVLKINTEKHRFSRADQLTQHLKERCRKLGIGEKFLSVRQIMDEFNVSQITVKQAMERLCESGVLEAQERRGYFVRHAPRYGKIACLIPAEISNLRWEFPGLLLRETSAAGFEQIIVDMPSNAAGIAMLPELKADAILFMPYGHEPITPDQLNRMMAQPVPVVILYGTVRVEGCRYVDNDNEFCGILAATHLLMNGHRKLAVLVSEPEVPLVRERIAGFLKCAEAYRLDIEVLNPHIRVGEHSPTKSGEFFRRYLEANPEPGFTGLFVLSELPAQEIARTAREYGLDIPEDFSLITLGRSSRESELDFTTINSRRDRVAHYAVRLVKEHFEQVKNAPTHYIITPEIHFGKTVKNINVPQLGKAGK